MACAPNPSAIEKPPEALELTPIAVDKYPVDVERSPTANDALLAAPTVPASTFLLTFASTASNWLLLTASLAFTPFATLIILRFKLSLPTLTTLPSSELTLD